MVSTIGHIGEYPLCNPKSILHKCKSLYKIHFIDFYINRSSVARSLARRTKDNSRVGRGAWFRLNNSFLRTIPDMSGWYGADLASLAEASSKDCLPLQFGLSKVMCDLFCIDDAVRAGTSTVLSTLKESHDVLMTNIQALVDYQTQYLLWAIGTVLDPQKVSLETHDILSVPALLEELRQFPNQEDPLTLDREVLDWHRATGSDLISRITAMSVNVSVANWPHRARSIKGMLHHYRTSFKQRAWWTQSRSVIGRPETHPGQIAFFEQLS